MAIKHVKDYYKQIEKMYFEFLSYMKWKKILRKMNVLKKNFKIY